MKGFILVVCSLLAISAFGANPPYEAFLGTNGIVVISNPPQGKILIDGKNLTNNLVLRTNANQFLGAPLSIKDGALLTNIFLQGTTINNGVISSRVMVLPLSGGLGRLDGSNQYYTTNLVADTTIVLDNFLEGAEYFLQVSNPASFNVTFTSIGNESWIEHPYVAGAATTNGITLFKFQRWGVKTNAFELGRNLTLTNDDGTITFTTNLTQLIIRAAASAGDSLWTSNNGNWYLKGFPTNIVFNPTNSGAGSGGLSRTATNFLFQTTPRRVGGTNQLFMVMNGGASAFVVGDQGIMIGSTNFIPVPQQAIDIAYDTAFNVDSPDKAITMTSYNSIVGYSGTAETRVSTNFGQLILTANKEGNGLVQLTETVGNGAWTNYDLQLLVIDANNTTIIPYQIDPDFSLSTIGYTFGSTIRITNTDTLVSLQNSNTPVFEVNGIGDLKLLKRVAYSWPSSQGAAATVLTNDGAGNLGWGSAGGSANPLSGTTNFFNLSVQAGKLPQFNFAYADAGWQAWETVYAETNDIGTRVTNSAIWQFMVPTDYATNSLKLLINYSLLNTNGPNTSNVVWGASVLSIRSGTTNNVHTNVFASVLKGSNDWIAKYDGTNICTNIVLDLGTNSLLMARDLCVLKLERYATEDTYGGAVAVHGLQVEYTRP